MSSIQLKNYYLDTANQNRLRNYVLTQLSKEYNIQPIVGQINDRFIKIMEHIAANVPQDNKANFQQNLERLNKLTVEKTLSGFSELLKPYRHIQDVVPVVDTPIAAKVPESSKDKNNDVGDLYSRLIKEREYTAPAQKTLEERPIGSTPMFQKTDGLPSVPEEPPFEQIIPNYRENLFKDRLEQMKQGRSNLQDSRNQLDLETRNMNYRQNVLGENPVIPQQNTDLQDRQPRYIENQNVQNVGKDLIPASEIREYRYEEYRNKDEMNYRTIDRQFFLNSKDRVWTGVVNNGTISNGLEPYRYRFQLNNNKEEGIFLQYRHKNITAIRIVAAYISITEIETIMSPYIFIYIPELENRLETSLPNRKFVFAVLTKDDRIGNQIKYVNFLSSNFYFPTPLAEFNNLTFEILNPLGYIYNDSKDDLKVASIDYKEINTDKYIVINTDKVYKSKQYFTGELLLIKNFGFSDQTEVASLYPNYQGFVNFMNRNIGHTIATPEEDITQNNYLRYIYIKAPVIILEDGTERLEPFMDEYIKFLNDPSISNPYNKVYGQLMNLNLQPSILIEISKIEPNSKEINQSRVQII